MSKEIVQINDLKADQIDLLKRTVCRGSTDDEFKMFMHIAKSAGLDPFTKQIHFVKRYDSKEGKEVGSVQTGIDGLRLIADRTGQYQGQTEPQWCGEDEVWKNVWLGQSPPSAARVGIYRSGFKEPVYAVARWSSYVQTYLKNGERKVSPMWQKMPDLMLSKVAEALALRKSFPAEMSGIYTHEEIQQTTVDEIEPKQIKNHAPTATTTAAEVHLPPTGNVRTYSGPSEAQLKRLYAIANSSGWPRGMAEAWVKRSYEKKPSELTRSEYDATCDALKATRFNDILKEELKPFMPIDIKAQFEAEKKKQSGYVDHTKTPLTPPTLDDGEITF